MPTKQKNNANAAKKASLVSVSFPGRDLCLAPVSLKSFAQRDKWVASNWEITIDQFGIETANEEIIKKLLERNARVFGFSVFVWNIEKILAVSKALKQSNPCSFIAWGGPEASGMAEKLLNKHGFIDAVFIGDGELAFRQFLKAKKLEEVPNIAFRKNGKIFFTKKMELESLDALSLPNESQDYKNYLDNSSQPLRAAIETSRGCPFSCGYCSWGRRKMKYFSLEKLKPALQYLFSHRNVSLVYVTDSNPFLKKDRAIELLRFIIEKNTEKKPVVLELAPEYIEDREILDLISKLNNDEFAFGVQSTSQKVLKLINRRFDAERYMQNVKLIKQKNPGVKIWFSLIIGLPGDSLQSFLDSTDFALNMAPDGIYFHELLCLPGSDFYSHPEKYGISFLEDAPHTILENRSFPPADYKKAKLLAYNILLITRLKELREKILRLHELKPETRHVDLYSQFCEFFSGKIDTLQGKSISDVSSWFFEQHANEFVSKQGNEGKLKAVYSEFEKSQTAEGEKNGA